MTIPLAVVAGPLATSASTAQTAPPGALAQLLTPNDCIAEPSSASGCGNKTIVGASGSSSQEWETAVTPDGHNVYTANNGSVQEFRRLADGSLRQLGKPNACISFAGKAAGCTLNKTKLTNTPTGIAANNKNVYVTDGYDEAVVEFRRNSDGSLTELGCLSELAGKCGTTVSHGLHGGAGPTTATISRDGKNVYVATGATTGGDIAEFARNATTGRLSQLPPPNDCISNINDASDCGTLIPVFFSQTVDVALSPDGDNVYVPFHASQTVLSLTRSTGGGLGYQGCLTSDPVAGNSGCGNVAPGLERAAGVVVSPNGKHVYVAAGDASSTGSVVELSRGAAGTLTEPANACIGFGSGTGCSRKGGGLAGANDVVISPNGHYLYTSSFNGRALAEFVVHANGSISQHARPDNCITESDGSRSCGRRHAHGLYGLNGLAVSTDGRNVYVAAQDSLGEFGLAKRLDLTVNGQGHGTVSGKGLACRQTCHHDYAVDSVVILTAKARSGSAFNGWHGACTGRQRCRVRLSRTRSVTASFRQSP